MTHWWRAYDHAVDNAKLHRLPADAFKAWFYLCCLASANNGTLPPISDVAFKLRVSEAKARNVIETLQSARLIDDDSGMLRMHDWSEYQYKSDLSTERVKQWRKQQRNVSSNVSCNIEETANETTRNGFMKQNGSVSSSLSLGDSLELAEPQMEQATRRKRKNKTQLPESFAPDRDFARKLGWPEQRIDQQIQAFFGYAKAHAKLYADWQAAWHNWCRSKYQAPVDAPKSDRDLLRSALG